jgi:hypothetical protein
VNDVAPGTAALRHTERPGYYLPGCDMIGAGQRFEATYD